MLVVGTLGTKKVCKLYCNRPKLPCNKAWLPTCSRINSTSSRVFSYNSTSRSYTYVIQDIHIRTHKSASRS